MKILIFGSVASGKTTLAKHLSEKLNIPHYEGDSIVWGFPNEKRYKRSNEEQKKIIDKINENNSWIVEGTYRESQKVLYDLADKIIFLDTPLHIRKYRIISRFIKQKIGYEKSNYKPSYDMLKHMFVWTKEFEKNRKVHEDRLMNYKDKLIWIKSVTELKGEILMSNKAVFLDLQGTLGGDGLGDIMKFEFFPYAIDAIKLLNDNNILAIVVTNQSHIAKGLLTMTDFNNRVDALKAELSYKKTYIDAVYCCPHGRNDNCECKKPKTGMLVQAQKDFNIELSKSYVIGDMGASDMVMANKVESKGILVRTGVGEGSLTEFRHTWSEIEPDYVADNVLEAVKWILKNELYYGICKCRKNS